jgi:hypothetical protein
LVSQGSNIIVWRACPPPCRRRQYAQYKRGTLIVFAPARAVSEAVLKPPGTEDPGPAAGAAVRLHGVTKWAVSTIRTLTPGDSVLTIAASTARVLEEGEPVEAFFLKKTPVFKYQISRDRQIPRDVQ